MATATVQDVQRAIASFNRDELGELYDWLDRFDPNPVDARLKADLDAGRFDDLITQALDDEKNGLTLPL